MKERGIIHLCYIHMYVYTQYGMLYINVQSSLKYVHMLVTKTQHAVCTC